jgi:hypothetical protein
MSTAHITNTVQSTVDSVFKSVLIDTVAVVFINIVVIYFVVIVCNFNWILVILSMIAISVITAFSSTAILSHYISRDSLYNVIKNDPIVLFIISIYSIIIFEILNLRFSISKSLVISLVSAISVILIDWFYGIPNMTI